METYISLLRGVNMTGHNSIKMEELTVLYKDLGFIDTQTYIQSGNVIFNREGDSPSTEISSSIESAIFKRFGYNVPVLIRTVAEMRKITFSNPFLLEEDFNPLKMAVIFLYDKPSKEQVEKVIDITCPPDKFKVIDSEIFTFCPNGFGRTKLYTNFFEKKMRVTGTARNWKTITTIFKIAENLK